MSNQTPSTHRPWWGDPHDYDTEYYKHYDDDGFALGLLEVVKREHNAAFGGTLRDAKKVKVYKDYTQEFSDLVRAPELPIMDLSLTTRDPRTTLLGNVEFECYFRIIKKEPVAFTHVPGIAVYRDTPGTAYAYYPAIERYLALSLDTWTMALEGTLRNLAYMLLKVLMESPEVLVETKRKLDPDYDRRLEHQKRIGR